MSFLMIWGHSMKRHLSNQGTFSGSCPHTEFGFQFGRDHCSKITGNDPDKRSIRSNSTASLVDSDHGIVINRTFSCGLTTMNLACLSDPYPMQ